MITGAHWEGIKEVQDALKHLNHKMGSSLLRSWNRKTAKNVVIPSIRNSIHSKRAQNNIKVQSARGEKRAVIVGPTSAAYWERWLQMGTKQRTTKKGYNRGSIRGNNQLEGAYEQLVDPVVEYAVNNMKKEVAKMLRSKIRSADRKLSKL